MDIVLTFDGFCPVCEQWTTYSAGNTWLRESLICVSCSNGSVPRERALASVLREVLPHWRQLSIVECSPANRGISLVLRQASQYLPINYFSGQPLGEMVGEIRNEDLQRLSLAQSSVDLFVALDVLEHVANPQAAVREISRVLAGGGTALLTFPIKPDLREPIRKRAELTTDGAVSFLMEPEWHGNPFDPAGSLVFSDFGYGVHEWLHDTSGLDVCIRRWAAPSLGVLGDFTEVVTLSKGRTV